MFIHFDDQIIKEWSASLLGCMTPILLVACANTMLLTNQKLPPAWRCLSWITKVVSKIRSFQIQLDLPPERGVMIQKKNQFGIGEWNFNVIAFFLLGLPAIAIFWRYLDFYQEYNTSPDSVRNDPFRKKSEIKYVAYLSGWAAIITLSFFLIPVTRHSVLLTAMNWSPIHALRIHIWAGYLSFFFVTVHGSMHVIIWFLFEGDQPIYRQFTPPMECWHGVLSDDSPCKDQFYDLTGLVAYFFFVILFATSIINTFIMFM